MNNIALPVVSLQFNILDYQTFVAENVMDGTAARALPGINWVRLNIAKHETLISFAMPDGEDVVAAHIPLSPRDGSRGTYEYHMRYVHVRDGLMSQDSIEDGWDGLDGTRYCYSALNELCEQIAWYCYESNFVSTMDSAKGVKA